MWTFYCYDKKMDEFWNNLSFSTTINFLLQFEGEKFRHAQWMRSTLYFWQTSRNKMIIRRVQNIISTINRYSVIIVIRLSSILMAPSGYRVERVNKTHYSIRWIVIHLVFNIIYPLNNLFHLCALVALYLLFSNIHRLAPQFEIFPKFFWSEIL